MNKTEVSAEKLINDLKLVVRDAEDLLKVTAGEAGEKAQAARERLVSALETAKQTCENLEERATEGIQAVDQLVRERPYQAVGVAFGIGLLLGVILNRK